MSCYHPNLVKRIVNDYTGEVYSHFTFGWGLSADPDKNEIAVPCGKCIGCRIEKSRQWADRMMLELDHSKTAIFLTLTYADGMLEPIPFVGDVEFYSLQPKHLTDFWKRLRYYFPNKSIRYYAAGEYGSKTFRPHYHAIVFGLSLDDFLDLTPIGMNEFGQTYFTSRFLEDVWPYGFNSIAPVSWRTCAYVARYVQKKALPYTDTLSPEERGVVPEYSVMSRRPGIGAFYLQDHPEIYDRLENGCHSIFYSDPNDFEKSFSRRMSVPKYIIDSLSDINPDLYLEIVEARSRFSSDRQMLELKKSSMWPESYLEVCEQNKIRQMRKLHRL